MLDMTCLQEHLLSIIRVYKVRFTPSNIDGKSLKATKWFTFDIPFMVDKGLFGN